MKRRTTTAAVLVTHEKINASITALATSIQSILKAAQYDTAERTRVVKAIAAYFNMTATVNT